MNKRFYKALRDASELRAIFVLIVVLALHFWRRVQSIYYSLPNILQIVNHIRARVLSSQLFDRRRPPAHWVGIPLSSRSIPLGQREKAGAALSLSKR